MCFSLWKNLHLHLWNNLALLIPKASSLSWTSFLTARTRPLAFGIKCLCLLVSDMANKEVIISWQKSQILITTKINYFLALGRSVHHSEICTEVAEKKNRWQTKVKPFKKGKIKTHLNCNFGIDLPYILRWYTQFCIVVLIHFFHCLAHRLTHVVLLKCWTRYCQRGVRVLQMSVGLWCLNWRHWFLLKGVVVVPIVFTPSLHKILEQHISRAAAAPVLRVCQHRRHSGTVVWV